MCEHIKFWPTHDSVEYVKSNGTTCVALSASIGTIVTSGRVDSAVCNIDTVAATQLVPFTTVPLFQPTLLDRLRSTNASSGLSVERMTQCANIPCVWYLTVEDLQLTSVSL